MRGTLTDEGAAVLNAAIDRLAAPRPALDGERDPRGAGQRRADALIDLAAAYLRHGPTGKTRGARPHVHVTVSLDTLRGDDGHPYGRTATGEDLCAETIRKLCCDAGITGLIVNTLGEPLAVGRCSSPPPERRGEDGRAGGAEGAGVDPRGATQERRGKASLRAGVCPRGTPDRPADPRRSSPSLWMADPPRI